MDWKSLVLPYSPWLNPDNPRSWRQSIPDFHRPVFTKLIHDLGSVEQYISVIGPRRVGKSTLLKQIVNRLISDGVPHDHIIYYSMDDPALLRAGMDTDRFLNSLMERMCDVGNKGPAYLMLDEIQALDNWELYLKKYYDLKYPVKILISGSASSPIFKKSRESLLGRIKDYHVLPFSYREFLLYKLSDDAHLQDEIAQFDQAGEQIRGILTASPQYRDLNTVAVPTVSDELWHSATQALHTFFVEGGFPEVWGMQTSAQKIEYLFDNQVQKVIYEDLVLATEFRKPEQLKSFYVSLLEYPGREVSRAKLSSEIGINVQQIDKYLPLLEMTDLIRHADKFRKSSVRLRKGNQKFYLVDLALRNAVLRLNADILEDDTMLGLYAENLVFNALKKWEGVLSVDYYREGNHEVDFVVHTKPGVYWPIEVKYRNRWPDSQLNGIRQFCRKFNCANPMVITKNKDRIGFMNKSDNLFYLPLIMFLMLWD